MTTSATHYSREELNALTLGVGVNVSIHRSVLFFGNRIRIGDRVRIDAYSILTGDVTIGNNCHIAAMVRIYGSAASVTLEDFCGVSSGCALYAATDDYVDGHLTGPTVPDRFRKVAAAPIVLRRHSVLGAQSVVLPGVELGWGATVGACSVVTRSIPELGVAVGVPARVKRQRDGDRLKRLESEYLASLAST